VDAAAGLNADDRSLIEFMENQEVGHAEVILHMLGSSALKMRIYTYPFQKVPQFVDFCQRLTRWPGVYGFISILALRPFR
jgi:hypothetical protein